MGVDDVVGNIRGTKGVLWGYQGDVKGVPIGQ